MKNLFKRVLAILHRTNHHKSAATAKPPRGAPLLEVRSQVKAGAKGLHNPGCNGRFM
jgi:hypothetical protein